MFTNGRYINVCIVLQLVTLSHCYPSFKSKIPNGNHVTDPCQDGGVWEGVGHKNMGGKGPLNPFGEAWKKSMNWSSICRIDSDKDGRTNGEELGDPNCVWTQGSNVTMSRDNITHPGICEPLDNPNCTEINEWLSCNRTTFRCNSTNKAGVEVMKLQLNHTEVPQQETTYSCMVFDVPRDQTYDVIAAHPIIGNKDVIHHMILYGCSKKDLKVKANTLVPDCFMPDKSGCKWMISAFGLWDTAADTFCLPSDIGVRIGKGGYEHLMVQFHWTNFDKAGGLTDNSGVEISYTPTLRKHNSGLLLFGQLQIRIPPNQPNVTISGGCQPFCSADRLLGPIQVIESFHHMHNYGVSQKIEVFRNGSKLTTVSDEENYSYNRPKFFRHYDSPIEVLPGDYIRTTCSYNTVGVNHTIHFGLGTANEMCFGFIRYYPLANLPLDEGGCSEYGNVPLCKVHTPHRYVVNGCDVKSVLTLNGVNTSNPLLSDMVQHCHLKDKCTRECSAVQQRMKMDPCFMNDIGMYVKYLLSYWRKWDGRAILLDLGHTTCHAHNGGSQVFLCSHVTTAMLLIYLIYVYAL